MISVDINTKGLIARIDTIAQRIFSEDSNAMFIYENTIRSSILSMLDKSKEHRNAIMVSTDNEIATMLRNRIDDCDGRNDEKTDDNKANDVSVPNEIDIEKKIQTHRFVDISLVVITIGIIYLFFDVRADARSPLYRTVAIMSRQIYDPLVNFSIAYLFVTITSGMIAYVEELLEGVIEKVEFIILTLIFALLWPYSFVKYFLRLRGTDYSNRIPYCTIAYVVFLLVCSNVLYVIYKYLDSLEFGQGL